MNTAPSFAIGEVESLVLKAYRGAGFSWGMAQEAGKAAAWLTAKRLPALDAFAALLNQIADLTHEQLSPNIKSSSWPERWVGSSTLLCPVVCGAFLSDLGPAVVEKESTVTLTSVASPLILLPFVATLGVPLTLRMTNAEVSVDGDVIAPFPVYETVAGKLDVVLQLAVQRAASIGDKTEQAGRGSDISLMRGTGNVASIKLLQALAHQTYVPATQESRESGAGAGLSDND